MINQVISVWLRSSPALETKRSKFTTDSLFALRTNKVLELWETYCIGKTNIIYERYKFNNRSQEQSESIDAYLTALRVLAETCEFTELKDSLIRYRIVCGAKDNAVRQKLLQESGLTLKKCIDMCRAAEATAAQLKVMAASQDPVKESNFVKKKKENKPTAHKANGKRLPSQLVADCKFCGPQHEKKEMPRIQQNLLHVW